MAANFYIRTSWGPICLGPNGECKFNIFVYMELLIIVVSLSSNTLCVCLHFVFVCFFLFCRFVVEVVKLYCHVMVTVSSNVVVLYVLWFSVFIVFLVCSIILTVLFYYCCCLSCGYSYRLSVFTLRHHLEVSRLCCVLCYSM